MLHSTGAVSEGSPKGKLVQFGGVESYIATPEGSLLHRILLPFVFFGSFSLLVVKLW